MLLHKHLCTGMMISAEIILGVRNASDKIRTGNEDTHFGFNNFILVMFMVMWKYVVEPARTQYGPCAQHAG